VFTIFGILNVITGVFVETAMRTNPSNRQVVIHEEMENKKRFLKELKELFEEMDMNGDGSISPTEFCERFSNERVIAYFKALGLDIVDAATLFRLLDTDHSDELDVTEFLSGCYQLTGEAKAIDAKMIRMNLQSIADSVNRLEQTQNESLKTIDGLQRGMRASEESIQTLRIAQMTESKWQRLLTQMQSERAAQPCLALPGIGSKQSPGGVPVSAGRSHKRTGTLGVRSCSEGRTSPVLTGETSDEALHQFLEQLQ